jgi:hypothetical protein
VRTVEGLQGVMDHVPGVENGAVDIEEDHEIVIGAAAPHPLVVIGQSLHPRGHVLFFVSFA